MTDYISLNIKIVINNLVKVIERIITYILDISKSNIEGMPLFIYYYYFLISARGRRYDEEKEVLEFSIE